MSAPAPLPIRDAVALGVGARSASGLTALQVTMSARALKLAPRPCHMIDRRGEAIATARLASIADDVHGLARFVSLGGPALTQAAFPWSSAPRARVQVPAPLPAIVALPARDRPGLDPRLATELLPALEARSGVALDRERSALVFGCRGGGVAAFERALAELASGRCEAVLVGGIDSYFDPDVLEQLDAERRLHTIDAENGFVPGEGAAFVLLASRRRAGSLARLAQLVGVAVEHEPHCFGSPEPCTAAGLTRAVRRAAASLGTAERRIAWALTDVANERHRVGEWVSAAMRSHRALSPDLVHDQPLLETGDVGAASAAMLVAMACIRWQTGCAPADAALVVACSDGPERGAMLVSIDPEAPPPLPGAAGAEERTAGAGAARRVLRGGARCDDGPAHGHGEDDEEGPGHAAARMSLSAVEEALFALTDVPFAFDREGVRTRLLRAIQFLYAVLDASVLSAAHYEGLTEAGKTCAEVAAMLSAAGDRGQAPALARGLDALSLAQSALRTGAAAVANVQLARRDELAFGRAREQPPPERPFLASLGTPRLHAFARAPLLPHVTVDAAAPIEAAPAAASGPTLPRPSGAADLAALVRALQSGELAAKLGEQGAAAEGAHDEPPDAAPLPAPFEPRVEEAEVLRRIARDCLEDVAGHRPLRRPNAIESWLDQGPFEQRLLDNLDAFAAFGGAALPLVSLYVAEASSPDPERAFSAALVLGSIDGADTMRGALMTLKQSAPETYEGWSEGFRLASSPHVDAAMAELLASSRVPLVVLALDVLHLRGSAPDPELRALLGRSDPAVRVRVARALGWALPRDEAIAWLVPAFAAADDDALFVAALESLLERGYAPAIDALRLAVRDGERKPRRQGAAWLLCLAGREADAPALVDLTMAEPSARLASGLGRLGHVAALEPLLTLLAGDDDDVKAAAAEALDRITGAGLREVVEEPWEVELPPEAEQAGALPIPTRRVERVVRAPAAWTEWLSRHASRLDPREKHRGGAPFAPLRIVEELEARTTPPARRADAAAELFVHVGRPVPFSPDDWVRRQKRHLAELRQIVERLDAAPGAWLARGAEPVRAPGPTRAPEAADAAGQSTKVRTSTMMLTLPAELAGVPPFLGASAPTAAAKGSPEGSRTPERRDSMPTPGLPFRTPPAVRAQPTAIREPDDRGDPPSDVAPSTSPPQTAPVPTVRPFDASLPFRPEPSEAAPFSPEPGLPFRRETPAPFAAASVAPRVPGAPLPLAQYALVHAKLLAAPERALAILAEHGIPDAAAWGAIDQAWRAHLARNPPLQRQWDELFAQARASLPPRRG